MSKLPEYEYDDYENSTDNEEEEEYDDNEQDYSKPTYQQTIHEEDDDDNEIVIRGKHIYENAATIDEIIAKLQKEIEVLEQLKTEGWELKVPVLDDYGFLVMKSTV